MRFHSLLIFVFAAFLFMAADPSANTIRPGQPDPVQAGQGGQGGAGGQGGQAGAAQQGAAQPGQSGGQEAAQPDAGAGEGAARSSGAEGGAQGGAGDGAQGQPEGAAGTPETGSQGGASDVPQNGGEAGGPASGQGEAGQGEPLRLPPPDKGDTAGQTAAEQTNARDKNFSITALGNPRSDLNGKPMVIPENTDNPDFLDGHWSFEKTFIGRDNQPMNADLQFNDKGQGTMTFIDKNNERYEASVDGSVGNGVLRMRTSSFTSKNGTSVYNPEFIECRNGANGAECAGTDGFGVWGGQRIFSDARRNESSVNRSESSRITESHTSSQSSFASEKNYTELSADGPEAPPIVMEKGEKATVGKNGPSLGALEGDWRFSQDLARKSDGSGVGMEFHFDKNGSGYSTIREGSGTEYKARAESMLMPDGMIRVKTDAYANGGKKGYYPTFMECTGKSGQELICNVSNGWMRVENGRLISLDSYRRNLEQMEMLLPTAPTQQKSENDDMADIFADMADKAAQAGKKASAAVDDSTSQSAQLQLPSQGDDSISFMQGSWLCKTGLVNTSENKPVVVRFTFNKVGKGTGTISEGSGALYRSSAQASYRDGILRIKTSRYSAVKGRGAYESSVIECRDNNGAALCVGKNGGITWQATFLRQK